MDPSYWQNTAFALFWMGVCLLIVVTLLGGLLYLIASFYTEVLVPSDKPKNVPSTEDVVLEHYRHMVNWTMDQPTGILKGDLMEKLKEEFNV